MLSNHNSVRIAACGLLAAVCHFAAAPASATTFRDGDYVCPYDGTKFKAHLIGSSNYSTETLDLRPTGTGGFPAPLPWPIAECPTNGFLFLKPSYTDEELERLRPLILSPEYQALRKESQHYRKKWILERTGATHAEITWALVGATWDNFRYANELVERLPQDISDAKGALRAQLKRLRGELLRKLGKTDEARQQFEEILAEEGRFTNEGLIARYELKLIARDRALNLPQDGFFPPQGGFFPHSEVTVAEVLAEFKNDPEVQEATQVPTLKNGTIFRRMHAFLPEDIQIRAILTSKVLWRLDSNVLFTNAKDGIIVIDPEHKDSKYLMNTYDKPRPKWSFPDEPELVFATQKSIFMGRRNGLVQMNGQTFDRVSSTAVPCKAGYWAMVLSYDERFVLCLLGDELVGRDIATRKLQTINFIPKDEVPFLNLKGSDPSGPRIAYTYRPAENIDTVVSWDYEKNVSVAEFSPQGRDLRNEERYWVQQINYSQDGRQIFVTGYYIMPLTQKEPGQHRDCGIGVWDMNAQKMMRHQTMPGEKVQLAVDPKGRYAAMACDRTINIYDAKLEATTETMALAGSGNVLSMAFSPDGKKFAVRTAGAVSVYEVRN